MGLRKVKGFLEWLYNTEVYKNEKLWQLLCAMVPNIEAIIGFIYAAFQWRSRSKLDKENKKRIEELEENYELQLREKDATIKRLKRSNKQYRKTIKNYKSKYENITD